MTTQTIIPLTIAMIGLILVAIGAYTEQRTDYIRHISNTAKRKRQRKADLLLLTGLLLITIGGYTL